ncbi:MAG TPA: hypothetical protein VF257_06425 [Solirubrobacteraceae bacterium]
MHVLDEALDELIEVPWSELAHRRLANRAPDRTPAEVDDISIELADLQGNEVFRTER